MRRVFVAGGTGYMDQRLIPRLIESGAQVCALVRPGSESKVPPGCEIVLGSALDSRSYTVPHGSTFLHLVGTPHPSPKKAKEFRDVELPSLKASVTAAVAAGSEHFVYVSVAHPAPIMQAYIEVRMECESIIRASGLNATILRPWYVNGARALVAVSVEAFLCSWRGNAVDSRAGGPPRPGDDWTNGRGANASRCQPFQRNPNR